MWGSAISLPFALPIQVSTVLRLLCERVSDKYSGVILIFSYPG